MSKLLSVTIQTVFVRSDDPQGKNNLLAKPIFCCFALCSAVLFQTSEEKREVLTFRLSSYLLHHMLLRG